MGVAMLSILQQVRRRMKAAQVPAAPAANSEYRRGYMRGLRAHYRVGQASGDDEHPRWPDCGDGPEYADRMRGYRDGLAGKEPQQ